MADADAEADVDRMAADVEATNMAEEATHKVQAPLEDAAQEDTTPEK